MLYMKKMMAGLKDNVKESIWIILRWPSAQWCC